LSPFKKRIDASLVLLRPDINMLMLGETTDTLFKTAQSVNSLNITQLLASLEVWLSVLLLSIRIKKQSELMVDHPVNTRENFKDICSILSFLKWPRSMHWCLFSLDSCYTPMPDTF